MWGEIPQLQNAARRFEVVSHHSEHQKISATTEIHAAKSIYLTGTGVI
jgi:hypothetical protein